MWSDDDGPYQGTFFAVSEFLNRQGVRWFMPGEFGECVPHAATIRVADMEGPTRGNNGGSALTN